MNSRSVRFLVTSFGILSATSAFAQQADHDKSGYDTAVLRAEISTKHIAMQPGVTADFLVNIASCDVVDRQTESSGGEQYDSFALDCTREATRLLGMPTLGRYIAYGVRAAPLAQGGKIVTDTLSGATCRFAEIDTVTDSEALKNANGIGFAGQFSSFDGDSFIKKENLVAVTTTSGAPATASLSINQKSAVVHKFAAIVGCANDPAFARIEFKPYVDYEPAGDEPTHVWETFTGNHSLQITQNEAWSVRSLVSSTNLDDSFFRTPLPAVGDSQISNGNAEFGNYVSYTIDNRNGNAQLSWGTPAGEFATLDSGSSVVMAATADRPNTGIEVNYLGNQSTRPPGIPAQPSSFEFPQGYTLELDYTLNGGTSQTAQPLLGGSCFGELDKCFRIPLPTEAGQVSYSLKWTQTSTGATWVDNHKGNGYSFQVVTAPQSTVAIAETGAVSVTGNLTSGSSFTINYDGNRALKQLRQAGISPNSVKVTAAVTFTSNASTTAISVPLRQMNPQNSGGQVPNYVDQIYGVIPAGIPAGTKDIQISFTIENRSEGVPSGSVIDSGSQYTFATK